MEETKKKLLSLPLNGGPQRTGQITGEEGSEEMVVRMKTRPNLDPGNTSKSKKLFLILRYCTQSSVLHTAGLKAGTL